MPSTTRRLPFPGKGSTPAIPRTGVTPAEPPVRGRLPEGLKDPALHRVGARIAQVLTTAAGAKVRCRCRQRWGRVDRTMSRRRRAGTHAPRPPAGGPSGSRVLVDRGRTGRRLRRRVQRRRGRASNRSAAFPSRRRRLPHPPLPRWRSYGPTAAGSADEREVCLCRAREAVEQGLALGLGRQGRLPDDAGAGVADHAHREQVRAVGGGVVGRFYAFCDQVRGATRAGTMVPWRTWSASEQRSWRTYEHSMRPPPCGTTSATLTRRAAR